MSSLWMLTNTSNLNTAELLLYISRLAELTNDPFTYLLLSSRTDLL